MTYNVFGGTLHLALSIYLLTQVCQAVSPKWPPLRCTRTYFFSQDHYSYGRILLLCAIHRVCQYIHVVNNSHMY